MQGIGLVAAASAFAFGFSISANAQTSVAEFYKNKSLSGKILIPLNRL
jgi:hypothetical protein